MDRTDEEVIELALRLNSITDAAKELDISRQRVGQIVPKGLIKKTIVAVCIDCGSEFGTRKATPAPRCERCRYYFNQHGLPWSEDNARLVRELQFETMRQTHCHRGHPLSGDNLLITPKGKRVCRVCNRVNRQAALQRPGYAASQREASRRSEAKRRAARKQANESTTS